MKPYRKYPPHGPGLGALIVLAYLIVLVGAVVVLVRLVA